MDLISLLYQQLNFLPHTNNLEQKRLQRAFQVAMDLQEHITVSLHLPEEVQKLVEQSQAEAIIRRNAQVIAGRLRVVAHDILYHQHSKRFSMTHELAALEKWRRSIPIIRSASFVITTSAASPACCAPSIRCTAAT